MDRDLIEQTIKLASAELDKESEWKDRYSDYAKALLKNIEPIQRDRELFHRWGGLHIYMPLNVAMGSACRFSLRYKGQDVAYIEAKGDKVYLATTQKMHDNNKNYFGVGIDFRQSEEWSSKKGTDFRKVFTGNANSAHTPEHTFESALLTELEKQDGRIKAKELHRIQPVKIAGVCRFQMPTPLTASSGTPAYARGKGIGKGGGIDILARTGTGGNSRLCVMELKTARSKTSAQKAMRQAVAYAVFLQKLLASKSGAEWYKIFGYERPASQKHNIKVCIVMPYDSEKYGDLHFCQKYPTQEGNLELCHIYVAEDWKNGISVLHSTL